jgi:hypothetical protein
MLGNNVTTTLKAQKSTVSLDADSIERFRCQVAVTTRRRPRRNLCRRSAGLRDPPPAGRAVRAAVIPTPRGVLSVVLVSVDHALRTEKSLAVVSEC